MEPVQDDKNDNNSALDIPPFFEIYRGTDREFSILKLNVGRTYLFRVRAVTDLGYDLVSIPVRGVIEPGEKFAQFTLCASCSVRVVTCNSPFVLLFLVLCYSPRTGEWDLPRLFVVGGLTSGNNDSTAYLQQPFGLPSLDYYDPSTFRWRTLPPMVSNEVESEHGKPAVGRCDHACVAWDARLFVIGGTSGKPNAPALKSMCAFDFESWNWYNLPSMLVRRKHFTASKWRSITHALACALVYDEFMWTDMCCFGMLLLSTYC